MCSVSAVMDYGRQTWPAPFQPNWTPLQPIIPNTPTVAEKEALEAFRELVRKAEDFDKQAKQPHCEDPEKIKLMERIIARLEAIEQRLGLDSGTQV